MKVSSTLLFLLPRYSGVSLYYFILKYGMVKHDEILLFHIVTPISQLNGKRKLSESFIKDRDHLDLLPRKIFVDFS